METTQFIETFLKNKQNEYDKRRKKYRKWAVSVTILGFTSAAMTTALLAVFKLYNGYEIISVVAIFMSAISTIMNATENFLTLKWFWLSNTRATMSLGLLISDFEHVKSKGGISQNVADEFYETYKTIVKEAATPWWQHRMGPGQGAP